eukprot:455665_1
MSNNEDHISDANYTSDDDNSELENIFDDNILYSDPIYQFEILKDQTLNNINWNMDHILHNQILDPTLNIIRNYIIDNDHLNEYKMLPPKIKHDLLNNKYYLNDIDILYYKHNASRNLLVLPFQQRQALMTAIHENFITGLHSGTNAVKHANYLKQNKINHMD